MTEDAFFWPGGYLGSWRKSKTPWVSFLGQARERDYRRFWEVTQKRSKVWIDIPALLAVATSAVKPTKSLRPLNALGHSFRLEWSGAPIRHRGITHSASARVGTKVVLRPPAVGCSLWRGHRLVIHRSRTTARATIGRFCKMEWTAERVAELSIKLSETAIIARLRGDVVFQAFFTIKAAECLALAKALSKIDAMKGDTT